MDDTIHKTLQEWFPESQWPTVERLFNDDDAVAIEKCPTGFPPTGEYEPVALCSVEDAIGANTDLLLLADATGRNIGAAPEVTVADFLAWRAAQPQTEGSTVVVVHGYIDQCQACRRYFDERAGSSIQYAWAAQLGAPPLCGDCAREYEEVQAKPR